MGSYLSGNVVFGFTYDQEEEALYSAARRHYKIEEDDFDTDYPSTEEFLEEIIGEFNNGPFSLELFFGGNTQWDSGEYVVGIDLDSIGGWASELPAGPYEIPIEAENALKLMHKKYFGCLPDLKLLLVLSYG